MDRVVSGFAPSGEALPLGWEAGPERDARPPCGARGHCTRPPASGLRERAEGAAGSRRVCSVSGAEGATPPSGATPALAALPARGTGQRTRDQCGSADGACAGVAKRVGGVSASAEALEPVGDHQHAGARGCAGAVLAEDGVVKSQIGQTKSVLRRPRRSGISPRRCLAVRRRQRPLSSRMGSPSPGPVRIGGRSNVSHSSRSLGTPDAVWARSCGGLSTSACSTVSQLMRLKPGDWPREDLMNTAAAP